MTIIYCALAWAAGITLARYAQLPAWLWGCGALASLAVALVSRHRPRVRLCSVICCALLLGGLRHALAQPRMDAQALAYYNDQGAVVLQGYISADPSIRATYTQIEVQVQEIELEGARYALRGKAVLNTGLYPPYEYGDSLRISGQLQTPPVLDDFDYREYLAGRGVHSVIQNARITRMPGSQGNTLLRWMYRRRRSLREVIEAILPNPDAGLISGILLGLGHTLPRALADAFRHTGLTHILVISGYNFGLVVQAIMIASTRFLMRWLALMASLAGIVLYALFVGPSPPVVRAALMGALFIVGQLAGRPTRPLTNLAAASLLMLMASPLLLWSASFQLSLAATLALILVAPALMRALSSLHASRKQDAPPSWADELLAILAATAAAQLLTLPVIWYHFREVSLVSLPANLLVLPLQPLLMAGGILATALGVVWLPAGRAAGWLLWPLTRHHIAVVRWFGALPWASIIVPRIAPGLMAGMGALAAALYALWHRPQLWKRLGQWLASSWAFRGAFVTLILVLGLVIGAILALPDGKLHIYFLDVGQGDAILMRTPGGRYILVDGGPDPLLLTSHLGQIVPFWQRKIDLLIATHADQDHIGGLLPVLKRYRVEHVLHPPQMAPSAPWPELLAAARATVAPAARGTIIELGEVLRLEVLHPPEQVAPGQIVGDNANSLVLRATIGHCSVLLTADIDAKTEQALLAAGLPLSATVLKVAHHGAGASSSAAFLEAVSAQFAILSVAKDNRFGHPAPAVLERLSDTGCHIYRTDVHGTIELITDGEQVWIKTQD